LTVLGADGTLRQCNSGKVIAMIRLVLSIALLLGFMALPASSQEADAEVAAPAGPETEEPVEVPPFDAEPFLNSMVALRGAGLTCAPYVGDDPIRRTQGVAGYFTALGQDLPDLGDEETQASLRRFIGSQAAMLCQSMLDSAFARYHAMATDYEANRPPEWPAAPAAEPGAWCAQPYCLDR